jgi:hypothetical protein
MNHKLVLWFGVFSMVLAACSAGSQPLRIAAFPVQPSAPDHTVLVIEAYDIDRAALRANQLANDFGGYTYSQRLTSSAGRRTFVLLISVPASQNLPLRSALARLGRVVDESSSHDSPSSPRRIYPEPDTTIELTLRESGYNPRPASPTGWDPRRTASQAFAVFQAIFSFFVDILIWVLIVIGPFVLVGWAVWSLIRRHKRSIEQASAPEGK